MNGAVNGVSTSATGEEAAATPSVEHSAQAHRGDWSFAALIGIPACVILVVAALLAVRKMQQGARHEEIIDV
jgi:ABC-type sulfate transport system permease subunit